MLYCIVLYRSALPQTRHVRGSNHVFINVVQDRIPGRVIIISAIGTVRTVVLFIVESSPALIGAETRLQSGNIPL